MVILGVQETIVRCVIIHNGSTVDDSYCKDVHLVPVERRVCNDINCPQRYVSPPPRHGFLSLQPPSSLRYYPFFLWNNAFEFYMITNYNPNPNSHYFFSNTETIIKIQEYATHNTLICWMDE